MNNKRKEDLRSKRLALFFTLGGSLRLWDKIGHLSRESRIYKRLAEQLGEIIFLTYGVRDEKYADVLASMEVLSRPWWIPVKLYSFLMPLIHWRALKKVDFLKTNQMKGAWTAVLAKILFRKKLVVRCGYEWKLFAKRAGVSQLKLALIHAIEWFCYRFADAVILTSEEMERFVSNMFGIPSEKIVVLPNYIDTDLFRPMDIEKVSGRLIFVGRFTEQKNLLNLLKAVKDLPEIELVLVGNGPLEGSLREFARKYNINVIFKGRVPNDQLPALLNTAEAFVLPSLYEGNSKALLEAMACGLPVIATPVEGNREVVKHKVNGYLTSGISPEAIREAIIKLFSDNSIREKLGRQARDFIEENYSLNVLIQKELSLLQNLIEK
ncbi:MAG: hypothetical protein DRG83_03525 [Deltaproteobacteria bacterium]|nr:MAG: hypothetical protein DRG83_03525 [Deltaproteobacteria bacterium]